MRLLVGLRVCSLVCVALVGCGDPATAQEKPKTPVQWGGDGGEPTRPAMSLAVRVEKTLHFFVKGSDPIKVPAGSYRVEIVGGKLLRLTAFTSKATHDIPAIVAKRTPVPTGCAFLIGSGDDLRHLIATAPDGRTFKATGSLSGVTLRGDQNPYSWFLPVHDESTRTEWEPNLRRVVIGPCDFVWNQKQAILSQNSMGETTVTAIPDSDTLAYGSGDAAGGSGDYLGGVGTAFAPVRLPAGSTVVFLHFAWVREFEFAKQQFDQLMSGLKNDPESAWEHWYEIHPNWADLVCILRSKEFSRRESYTLGFTQALFGNGEVISGLDEFGPTPGEWTGMAGADGKPYIACSVIGRSTVRMERQVHEGEALYLELRLPGRMGGNVLAPVLGVKPDAGWIWGDARAARRFLGAVVEYYVPK